MKSAFRLILIVGGVFSTSGAFAVEAEWREAMQGYHRETIDPIPDFELPALQQLFERTVTASDDAPTRQESQLPELDDRWAVFGFKLLELHSDDEVIWMLRDRAEAVQRGVYMLRCGRRTSALILQAPHSFNDLNTGDLVLKLFTEGDAKAACWNSVSRHAKCGDDCLDVARREDLPFNALTVAFAIARPESRVVQFHGFDPESRTTEEGRSATMILSSGTVRTSPVVQRIASALLAQREIETTSIRVFSESGQNSVKELGATKNAQAKSLLEIGYGGFVHMEMGPGLREDLLNDAEARAVLLACLE